MPGMTSIWHWLIVLVVVALLFGAGRISGVMGDLGKGIKSFKKGLHEDDDAPAASSPAAPVAPPQRITDERVAETRPTGTPSVDRDRA